MNIKNNQFIWPQIGNEIAINFLKNSVDTENIAPAYIFTGPKDVGKFKIAKYFASELIFRDKVKEGVNSLSGDNLEISSSGDLQILSALEGKQNISISQVRDFNKNLSLSSFLNNYKVGIIREAQKLSLEASNALLKTLEEPKDKVTVILLTSNTSQIIPTIRSRSQLVNFYPSSSEVIYDYLVEFYGADRLEAKKLARLALGKPALAVKLLEDKDYYNNLLQKATLLLDFFSQDISRRLDTLDNYLGPRFYGQTAKEEALDLLSIWDLVLRDMLLIDKGQADLIAFEALKDSFPSKSSSQKIVLTLDLSDKIKKYLLANVNAKTALEELIISF